MHSAPEAANLKLAVEDYVTKTLVPMGVPLVVTSRPEGIRKRLYSRDFVIMNLKPLGEDQQQKIIEKQLQQNSFFRRLHDLLVVRRDLEKHFESFAQVANMNFEALGSKASYPANSEPDHELLTAVFFCLAMKLLREAGLDQSALQLPVFGDEDRDLKRRMSVQSRRLGSIRSDLLCSSESFAKVIQLLASGVETTVDGEAAQLELLRVKSYLKEPGLMRLRYVQCDLALLHQQTSYPVQVGSVIPSRASPGASSSSRVLGMFPAAR